MQVALLWPCVHDEVFLHKRGRTDDVPIQLPAQVSCSSETVMNSSLMSEDMCREALYSIQCTHLHVLNNMLCDLIAIEQVCHVSSHEIDELAISKRSCLYLAMLASRSIDPPCIFRES